MGSLASLVCLSLHSRSGLEPGVATPHCPCPMCDVITLLLVWTHKQYSEQREVLTRQAFLPCCASLALLLIGRRNLVGAVLFLKVVHPLEMNLGARKMTRQVRQPADLSLISRTHKWKERANSTVCPLTFTPVLFLSPSLSLSVSLSLTHTLFNILKNGLGPIFLVGIQIRYIPI